MAKHPERVIEHAVKGMLPKNTLGRKQGMKLKVYAGAEHPHMAQKPPRDQDGGLNQWQNEALYYGTGRQEERRRPRSPRSRHRQGDRQRSRWPRVLRSRSSASNYAEDPVQGDRHPGSLRRARHVSTAAASRARPALCATASPAPCSRLATTAPSSRSAGYLTRDARMVERKKYGLKKARKRPQFSKR